METIETATIFISNDDEMTEDIYMTLPKPQESTKGNWYIDLPETTLKSTIRIKATTTQDGWPDPIIAVVPYNLHDAERIALLPDMIDLVREVATQDNLAMSYKAKQLLSKLTNPETVAGS